MLPFFLPYFSVFYITVFTRQHGANMKLFWPAVFTWQYRAFMLPFFLLYFPWTLRQCSDCCIVLLYCPGQNGRVLFGVFAGVLAGTTEVSHDLAGVPTLLY